MAREITEQEEILNLTLSAIADTEIVFEKDVLSVAIRNRGTSDLEYRVKEGGTSYFTIPLGTTFTRDFSRYATKNAGWLRAAAGTGPAEIVGALVP